MFCSVSAENSTRVSTVLGDNEALPSYPEHLARERVEFLDLLYKTCFFSCILDYAIYIINQCKIKGH